jgi:hypothetical protein
MGIPGSSVSAEPSQGLNAIVKPTSNPPEFASETVRVRGLCNGTRPKSSVSGVIWMSADLPRTCTGMQNTPRSVRMGMCEVMWRAPAGAS